MYYGQLKVSHELVFGPSGGGKTTYAKKLAKKLNLPVINMDFTDKANELFRPFIRIHDSTQAHLKRNTPINEEFHKIMREVAQDALAKKERHIIEGTQFMGLTPEELKGHNIHIINPPLEQVLKQRAAREKQSRIDKGKAPHNEEQLAAAEQFTKKFYKYCQPYIKEYK
jgi:adenylate kinase family enzyme